MSTATNNKAEFNKVVYAYIVNCINSEETEFKNDREKFEYLAQCFRSEYVYPANLKRFKTYQNTLSEWFQGLPGSFNIDFYHHKIILISGSWSEILNGHFNINEETVLENWFKFIANSVIKIWEKENINYKL